MRTTGRITSLLSALLLAFALMIPVQAGAEALKEDTRTYSSTERSSRSMLGSREKWGFRIGAPIFALLTYLAGSRIGHNRRYTRANRGQISTAENISIKAAQFKNYYRLVLFALATIACTYLGFFLK